MEFTTVIGHYITNTRKTFVKFEMQLWPWTKVKIIGLRKEYNTIFTANLNSFWNKQTFIIFMIKICVIWMKVKVNIINTWCILMSEAVTVLSLMMMTLIVFEESLARGRHTHRHTKTRGRLVLNFFKVRLLQTKTRTFTTESN